MIASVATATRYDSVACDEGRFISPEERALAPLGLSPSKECRRPSCSKRGRWYDYLHKIPPPLHFVTLVPLLLVGQFPKESLYQTQVKLYTFRVQRKDKAPDARRQPR